MVQHALEMEDDEEESLMHEVLNGNNNSNNSGGGDNGSYHSRVGGNGHGAAGQRGHPRAATAAAAALPSAFQKKAALLFGVATAVALLLLYTTPSHYRGGAGAGPTASAPRLHDDHHSHPAPTDHDPGDDDGGGATTTTAKASETTGGPAAPGDSAGAPAAEAAAPASDAKTAKARGDGAAHHKPSGSSTATITPPPPFDADTGGTGPPPNAAGTAARLYSKIATIVPDSLHVPVDAEAQAALAKQWGRWHFWDGDEMNRPTNDYCAAYPNRDMPGRDFPDNAWQVDAVFVNHLLNDGEQLVARAMEAIYAEYGRGKPLTPEGLADRAKMFHWDRVDLTGGTGGPDGAVPPPPPKKYAHKGDRGNGGWTTQRSFDGLVQRLLHACLTNDNFTVVLGGHSAAAGHGNHFHQSYLMQFHKIVAPVLARFGVTLVTRNLAQGGLGTLHNALGAGSLYGDDVDVLLWDAGMTETDPAHADLFMRQGLLGGHRVPVLWGGPYDVLRTLHEAVGADVGEYGTGLDGVTAVTSAAQAVSDIPYAARYLKCDREQQDVCKKEAEFCTHCWIDRPDIPDPKALFPQLADKPKGQVKWHPGWRRHQLTGRLLAFSLLDALQVALQIWSDGTMGGPPLDDEWWHVTDYYATIRDRVRKLDPSVGACHRGLEGRLPTRVCNTPLQARSLFTPRNNPHATSLTTIFKPAPNGYVPRNTETVLYQGPDAHNPCYDIPDGEVDVLAIVSGRRRLAERARSVDGASGEPRLAVNSTTPLPKAAAPHAGEQRRRPAEVGADDAIVMGQGWQVVDEPPGQCDGEYESICGRHPGEHCPLLRHHDSRGCVVGNEYAGWLVMTLPNLRHGIVILKIVTNMPPESNTRTDGWTTVNNDGRRRLYEADEPPPPPLENKRHLRPVDDLPESFLFDYAIDGEITTLNKSDFAKRLIEVQRAVEMITLLDDPDFATSAAKTVEVAIRMRGCGRECTLALSHAYWA